MDCFFRFISAALRKIKFLLKANVAKRVRLIFARVAHAIVTQNWLFVSMACKITLVTVNRASRGTENIVKVWPFLIDTAQLGPKPIWNSIKIHIFWEGRTILRNLHLTFDWHYITKVKWRFRKILWPSQNIWTLKNRLRCTFTEKRNML